MGSGELEPELMATGYAYNTVCCDEARRHIAESKLPRPFQDLAVYCELRKEDLLFCYAWDRQSETLIIGIPNLWRIEHCPAETLDQRLIEELAQEHGIRSTSLLGYGPVLDLLNSRS